MDEFAHVPIGYALWRGAPLSAGQSTPPFTRLLIAAPLAFAKPPLNVDLTLAEDARGGRKAWAVAQRFMEQNRGRFLDCFFRARLVVVGLALFAGLVVFAWARHSFGTAGGVFVLFLFGLSPQVLAHSGLATTDLALAAFFVAALFFWSLYLEGPRPARLSAAALCCAAACLTKYSGPILMPLFVAVAALAAPRGRRARAACVGLAATAATLGLAFFVLYGPDQLPTRLRDLPLQSRLGRGVAASPMGSLPLPLPRDYVAGFDTQFTDAEATASYLFGKWGPGQRHYYVVALGVKTPIPILAFLVVPLLFRAGRRAAAPVAATVLMPAAVYFASVSASNLQLGVRYVFPAYVLVLVHAGAVPGLLWDARRRASRAAFVVLAGWLLASVLAARPHFLPYFNEVAGGRQRGDRILIDSNIDWGQDLGRLAAYLRRRGVTRPIDLAYFGHVDPGLYGIAWRPAPMEPPAQGTRRPLTVVSVNFVRGYSYALDYARPPLAVPPTAYRWLEAYEPVDRVGGSLNVYEFEVRPAGPADAGATPAPP